MDIIHNSKRLLFEEKEDFWMKKNKMNEELKVKYNLKML